MAEVLVIALPSLLGKKTGIFPYFCGVCVAAPAPHDLGPLDKGLRRISPKTGVGGTVLPVQGTPLNLCAPP